MSCGDPPAPHCQEWWKPWQRWFQLYESSAPETDTQRNIGSYFTVNNTISWNLYLICIRGKQTLTIAWGGQTVIEQGEKIIIFLMIWSSLIDLNKCLRCSVACVCFSPDLWREERLSSCEGRACCQYCREHLPFWKVYLNIHVCNIQNWPCDTIIVIPKL